jgi:Carboxylesterase family
VDKYLGDKTEASVPRLVRVEYKDDFISLQRFTICLTPLELFNGLAKMPLQHPVSIDTGRVTGVPSSHNADVTVFRGIPFAATTAGQNRWRPPQPAEPWEGVRDCSSFGPIAPQLPPGPLYWTESPVEQSEDCLNLSLWTPAEVSLISPFAFPVACLHLLNTVT